MSLERNFRNLTTFTTSILYRTYHIVPANSRTLSATQNWHTMHTRSKVNGDPRSASGIVRNKATFAKLEGDKMAYDNCKTRIIDLRNLPTLRQGKDVTDEDYRRVYKDYLTLARPHASPFNHDADIKLKSSGASPKHTCHEAQFLRAAIQSLTTGIAPPVAFPTETVYGLGADATNAASIAGIFAAKGRPSDNPLIVHVSSVAHLERCLGGDASNSAIPAVYRDLIAEFWPGPLTILVPVPEEGTGLKFAPNVHPGQKTIGFRLPESPFARFLIAVANRPIAAPSANSSGKPSPTTAQHVKDDLDGKINFILDGGECGVGVESTVVDGLHDPPLILRPGGLSKSDLRAWGKNRENIWQHVQNGWEYKAGGKRKRVDENTNSTRGKIGKSPPASTEEALNMYDSPTVQTPKDEDSDLRLEGDSSDAPRAPGMKYKHYAPAGKMLLFQSASQDQSETSSDGVIDKLNDLLHRPFSLRTKKYDDVVEDSYNHFAISILSTSTWPNLTGCIRGPVDIRSGSFGFDMPTNIVEAKDQMHITAAVPASAKRPSVEVDVYQIALGKDPETIARRLFAALRQCDDWNCAWILVEAPSGGEKEDDMFETVLERMRKAASEVVTTT